MKRRRDSGAGAERPEIRANWSWLVLAGPGGPAAFEACSDANRAAQRQAGSGAKRASPPPEAVLQWSSRLPLLPRAGCDLVPTPAQSMRSCARHAVRLPDLARPLQSGPLPPGPCQPGPCQPGPCQPGPITASPPTATAARQKETSNGRYRPDCADCSPTRRGRKDAGAPHAEGAPPAVPDQQNRPHGAGAQRGAPPHASAGPRECIHCASGVAAIFRMGEELVRLRLRGRQDVLLEHVAQRQLVDLAGGAERDLFHVHHVIGRPPFGNLAVEVG